MVTVVVTERSPEPGGREPGPGADERRREMADFLRRRREAIRPEQVGLPVGGRRRTPGLRREEVAQIAGVGVTWYTWLEQAREIRVSENVLDALSRALLLDSHERAHLFNLAGAPSAVVTAESDTLDPAVGILLERFGTYPAAVVNSRSDILAYNSAYGALIGDIASVPFDRRNLVWLMFTSAPFRTLLVDWEHAARRVVASLRASYADHMSEPVWRSMIKRLQDASPTFYEYWQEHRVGGPENVVKQFRHPQLGLLRFNATHMWLTQRVGNRMMVYTPTDAETHAAVVRLARTTPAPL